MVYVNVHVDADDLKGELSDKELLDELQRRKSEKQGFSGSLGTSLADYRIPPVAAREALTEASDRLRKLDHYALAFKLDEIRIDCCS